MIDLSIDFETRSDVDLKTRGAYNYFDSPHAKPLMASYSIAHAPVKRWLPDQPCPQDIVAHVEAGGMVSAHNASFERLLWQKILTPQYRWPEIPTKQFRCTAATAAAMALPRSLDMLGDALGLTIRKDKTGAALIRKFCMPRKPKKGEDPNGVYFNEPWEFPEDFAAFHDYCDTDVLTEIEADKRMVPLSAEEQAVWVLDQQINDRGIRIDVKSARAALAMAEKEKRNLDREIKACTNGYVTAVTQPGKLVEWVVSQGVDMETARKAEVEELLHLNDLAPHVRRAIEIRQEGAKTSVSKLKAMLARACADNRVRGAFMYCGAGTGRWASMGVNFTNMPRYRQIFEAAKLETEALFATIRTADPDFMRLMYGPDLGRPMHLLSDAVRGFIWAAPGHDLVQADYSGIEGAVAAWLAGEEWKLEAMRAIIADPSIPDMYRQTAAGIMNMSTDDLTKKHPLRQSVGKVSELALGFGGGVSAFYSMSQMYGVDLDSLFDPVWTAAPESRREKAQKRYYKCLKRGESKADVLSERAWIACEIIKLGWRETNPAIAAAWKACESAARDAVSNPGTIVETLDGKLAYIVRHGFLWLRLPSGRCLAYGAPKLKAQVWACLRGDDGEFLPAEVMGKDEAEKLVRWGEAKIDGETTPAVTVLGTDAVTRKMKRHALYGGIAFQNCLAAEAEVLTPYGWKRIVDIQLTDKVWDGLQWVSHAGVIFQGLRSTIEIGGLRLTPDHKVWTDDGWKRADDTDLHEAASASPDPEADREALRAPRSHGVRGRRRAEGLVEGPLRLRHRETVRRFGTSEGQRAELRLLPARSDTRAGDDARYVAPCGLPRMGQHDRSLLAEIAFRLPSLRRAGHYCLRALDAIRELLAGHGTDVGSRPDLGAPEQREGLQPGKLRLARPEGSGSQPAQQQDDKHAEGAHASVRGIGPVGHRVDDALLPSRCWVADEAPVRSAGCEPEDNVEPVYDLLNAGPRRRFTVRAGDHAIIVSNCVQAAARDILVNGMWKAEGAGYPIIAHVYDEMICEVPAGQGDLAEFEALICELPAWAEGLPLTAGGWRGKRYRKD